jgi:Ca2+-binding RTX toxin-like protein
MAQVDLWDGVDMGTFQQTSLSTPLSITWSSTRETIVYAGGVATMTITGQNLTFNAVGTLTGGTVTGLDVVSPNGHFQLTGASVDGGILGLAYSTNDNQLSISTLLAGDDTITVRGTTTLSADSDFTAMGWGGNDLMKGGGNRSSLYGGDGDDTVLAFGGDNNYLRGDAGQDSIVGALGFDDINGNMGNDTCSGDAGDDWVVGGKDQDRLFGGSGGDIVLGNLGDDTIQGDDGSDIVRGGQGNDIVSGGIGNDYLSGDRGDDTVTGGAGADVFHSFGDAGLDRVLDFHISEGDRVMLDPGTTYTVSQVGADTVINMVGGGQMTLVGVTASGLPEGSIFIASAVTL